MRFLSSSIVVKQKLVSKFLFLDAKQEQFDLTIAT